MIKKIFPTEFDHFNLSVKRTQAEDSGLNPDYKGVVVDKPWGYEYLMYENKQAAVWILYLKPGASTSMHCHPKKKTSLSVLDGEIRTSTLDSNFILKNLDGLIIDRGVFHSTRAASEQGAFIMEIETPPQKNDLVRLKDAYGRENMGYEGQDKMSSELHKYEYSDFHGQPAEERKIIEKVIKQCKVVMHSGEDWKNLKKEIKDKEFCLVSFLDAVLIDSKNKTALEAGEICEGKWLLENYDQLEPSQSKFNLLSIN